MAKDPAFLFYPGDYLRDTQMLSEKTQVAYDRIMCEHMRNICITQQQLKFLTKRLSEQELDELMMTLTKVNGGYQIEWVAESIRKRKSYSESRRKNRKGKNKKDMLTYDKHMENENEIENVIKSEVEKKDFDFSNLSKKEKQKYWDKFLEYREKMLSSINYEPIASELKLSVKKTNEAINDFFKECKVKEDIYRNFLDYKSHCFNWIKTHINDYKSAEDPHKKIIRNQKETSLLNEIAAQRKFKDEKK